MTTRWKQKASMALIVIGIICVFLLIILLWSAISNGMLRTKSSSSISSSLSSLSSSLSFTSSTPSFVLISSDIELDNNSQRQQQQQKFIQSSLETNMIDTVLDDDDDNIQQHKNHHQKLLSQDIINLDDYITEEFIKPIKLHHLPLLHTDDLLYESIKYKNRTYDDKNYNNGNNDDGGYKFTGNYRSKTNKIWDPHPEYDIKAFGHNMHLILYQDGSFVPETFKVTNVYRNRTEIHIDNHKNDIACHYRGNVLGDEESAVAVSLCEGMTGHIKTSFGSFFIQPIEKYETNNKNDENNNSTEILHRIWREPIKQHDERKQSLRQYSKNYHNCPLEEHMKGQHRNNFKDLPSLSSISSTFSTFQRDHDENQQQQQQHSRKKRNIYNSNDHQYTLEVLIAIDRKMSEFHGEHKIKHYVLTLMSIVSNIFADASIGNSINVAVINIMVLKEDLSLEYIEEGVYASHLLKKFCSFMQKRSDHYDTAILLTREQICRNTTEKRCDTLGLAELGTVCKRHSCSIVQDNGLSAAFTIAHELGHILNMPHDDDEKCSKFEKHGKRMLNIMSSTMGDEIHPWSWSDCSRHFVTEFLEQDDVSCMEDTPTRPYNRTTKKLPGELFNLDQQCELIHGPGAIYCSSNTDNECGRLWCYDIISNSCRSINLPWADGTPCYDSYHWCQKGECVNRDRKHLRPIDGGWGPWGPYSPCSRTCGGGVQESLRECNNPAPQNGGRYCLGNHKRYRSCQTEDCPPESMDFREKQCFDLNGNNFDLPGIPRSVKWIPKYGVSPKEECKLHCRIKGSNAYFQLVDKVVDGTTCSFDSFNKCVNGICRPAACDNVLYSNAKLDRCGVCEGDNSTCVEISKVFYKSDLDRKPPSRSKIYYHVVTIPKGASNVVITQPGYPLTNYIVLLDDEGKYLINGDNIINTFSRSIPYDGVTLNYTGSDSILEKVVTTYARKLRKDLVVEILSLPKEEQTENKILMTYSYTISTDHPHYYSHYQHHNQNQHFSDRYHYIQRQHHNLQQHHHPYHNNINNNNNNNNNNYHVNSYDKEREMITYRWDVDQWSPCDSLCNGKKYRNIVCIQIDARHKVDDTYCNNIPKPSYDLQSSCNTDCEIVRELENVSECSAPCEKRGVQYKSYKCIQKYFHTNYSIIIDRSYCEVKHSMKTEEECIGSCSNWTYTDWTPCSLTCSWNGQTGKQTRSVVCIKNGKIVDDLHCSPTRRYHFNDVIRPCNTEPCPYEYSYGEETPCSVTCGIGQRTTAIYCKQNNQIVDKILCAGKPMLSPIIRNCTMPPCHNNTRQQRRKRPLKHVPQSRHIYSDRNHNNPAILNKPIISNLDFISWETGEWSMCNRDNCQRNRTVYCKDSTKYSCPENRKPESTQNCCKIKYVQKWSPCSVDCGIGIRRKEFICARVSQPLLNGEKRFKIPIDPQYCRSLHLKLPNPKKRIKNCKKKFCKWVTGPWSQCTCNTQTPLKTRVVNCKNVNGDIVEQTNCNTSEKPKYIANCTSCTSEANIRIEKVYTQCSCDGRRKRRIICYDQNNKHTKCPEGPQYESSSRDPCTPPEECLPHSCVEVRRRKRTLDDGNYLISINKRPIKIYCHNMTGRPQEYINVNSSENLSIYYHKRSIDIDNCPTQSRNNEYDDASIPSGSTSFDKIAINLSTMRIIEDDYTFATITGKPQPYGSAGDCYNRSKNCPQGYFSINLKDTGFRIHSKIKWDTDGHYSTIDFVQKLEYPYQVVKAYCGGYCGKCSISKDTNLILDVV